MFDKRIVIVFFLFFAAIGMLSSVSAEDSIDIVNATCDADSAVDVGEDNDDSILEIEDSGEDILEGSATGTFTELQKKIDNAKKGSTIYLTKDYEYDNDFSTNGIKITKSLTIDGKGHSIDGAESSALLLINKANNVVLKNIVFKNGYIEDSGVLAIFHSDNVKFSNCNFYYNRADEGGAVFLAYSNHSSFAVCDFIYNYAEYGGAIFFANCYDSSLESCRFGGNGAGYDGGAIYLDDCYENSFDSCIFSKNNADCGGAFYLINCQDSSFDDCNFNYNEAKYGGAVYLSYSSSSFVGCNFKLKSLNLDNITRPDYGVTLDDEDDEDWDDDDLDNELYGLEEYLDDNPSEIDYGTIYSFQSFLNILNSIFNNSYANAAGADISSQQSMIFLTNSSFSNSLSKGYGGSLNFDNDYVQITNCSFEKCMSFKGAGGAAYCLNSILDCYSSQFINCSAGYGGSICSINTDLVIRDNTFDNSYADHYGGSIFTRFGSICVDGSVFSYSFGWNGGAIYIGSPYLIGNITNNLFLYCSARNNGYRILVDGYYDEIPESGNIYEDVYFVYGKFDIYDEDDIEIESYNCSNILTYVFSSSGEYQNNLSFYDSLRKTFISKIEYNASISSFTIFDEEYPDNSTIFLGYGDYNSSNLTYDVGHLYKEFNSSNLNVFICNVKGMSLDNLQSRGFLESEKFGTDCCTKGYYSPYYAGFYIAPVSDEKNITVFDDYEGVPYFWICQINPEEVEDCKIKGRLSFNFTDDELCYNDGNSYRWGFDYSLVPVFNPIYGNESPEYRKYVTDSYSYVKDQDIGSNCWAFAGITALERCINKITGESYDFSVNNVKNLMAASSIYGLNLDTNGGGYDSMLMSYLASWMGPINEENDKYNPLSSLSMRQSERFHIQNIAFLSPRKNSMDNDEFKYAIKNYGAVAVTFNWTTNEYTGLHSVCIIGWDDDYRGLDCLGNRANGAWIFQNSWGDFWGDSLEDIAGDEDEDFSGYGYLAYGQKLSGEITPYLHAYTFVFNDGDAGYQKIYQYDFAGFTDYLCSDGDCVYYKNKFVATGKEYLLAFSTYFEKPAYFTFSVRINGKDINMTDDNVPIVNSIRYSPAGYHTIPLGYNLTLNENDEYEIIIRLVNADSNYVPVSQADELYKLTYPSNVSFISYNGEEWFDLYDLSSNSKFLYGGNKSNTCQVACIKAFTRSCKTGTLLGYLQFSGSHILSSFYETYTLGSDMYRGTVYMYMDRDADFDQWEYYVELNVNDGEEIHYLKFDDGCFYLYPDEFDNYNSGKFHGKYKCSAKLVSNFLSSNEIYFDIICSGDEVYSSFSELQEIINNASEGSVIDLDRDYCFYADSNSSEHYILINKSLTIDGNPFMVNRAITSDGRQYYDDYEHTLNGFNLSGIFKILPNCNVTLKNINFKNGHSDDFGAIVSYGNLTVINCDFIGNYANLYGGAIFADESSNLKIINSYFMDNGAAGYGGTIFSRNILNITDSHFDSDADVEIIYFNCTGDESIPNLYLKNNKMTSKSVHVFYDGDAIPYGSHLSLIFYKGSKIKGESVDLFQIVDDDGNTFRLKDVNVTLGNQNVKIQYSRALGGYVFDTSSLAYGTYKLTGSVSKLYASDCTVRDGILYVVKKSVLKSSGLVKAYATKKKLAVTLKDNYGKAIANVYLTVKLNGKTFKIKTNSKGQAQLAVKLAPKKYTAAITFAGNTKYSSATKMVKVIVKKATPKIKAKKKTFKLKTKVKKYTVTLKNNLGKAMKKTKLAIKVKGKTYKAKTNSKGKATFKIRNLKKKGTFKAAVKYGGNKYYNKVTKKVRIKVKC